MTPIKELGECVIGTGDREFFFRPSFRNMARIGEPEEIVQAFYDLCNDETTSFAQRAAEAYIRDEYSRLPDCVLRFMQSGLLSRKAIMAAHTVLTACCDDDIGDLVGWMKPGKSRKRGFVWRPGSMPPESMVNPADGPALGAQQRGRDGGRGSLHYRSDELFPGDQCLGVLREGSKRFHGGPTKKHSD